MWDTFMIPNGNWLILGPVLSLIVTGVLEIILGMFWKKTTLRHMSILSLIGIVIAMGFWSLETYLGEKNDYAFGNLVVKDNLTYILQPLILFIVGVLTFISEPFLKTKKIFFNEFYPLLLWSASGAILLVSTTHWLMIFISLELFSLSLYVLCGLNIYKKRSEESALKYFLLGTFASAFLLYGIALLYGATGSLQMEMVAPAWALDSSFDKILLLLGHFMVLVGFFFKLGIVPFHFWSPDVYQGAPTNITAYMATVGKVVSLGVIIRILEAAGPFLKPYLMPLMVFLTLLTILVSNIMALRQKSFKRLLAFSSISHSGYLMVGLLSAYSLYTNFRISFIPYASLQYLYAYAILTLGIFVILIVFAQEEEEDTLLDKIKALLNYSPYLGFAFIGFILSIAGIPPFVGFFAKLNLFLICFESKQYFLMSGLILGSLIGVSYYLKIAQLVFVSLKSTRSDKTSPSSINILINVFFILSLIVSPFIFPMFFK